MEAKNKNFWQEAAIAGAILGLARVIISAIKYVMSNAGTPASTIVTILGIGVTVYLIFKYTQKYGRSFSKAEGFSYGASFAFILVTLLFAGVLEGIWSTVHMIYLEPQLVMEQMEMVLKLYQDILPADQFDEIYDRLPRIISNPAIIIFANVLVNAFIGLFWGLILSAFTKRNPDIFADANK